MTNSIDNKNSQQKEFFDESMLSEKVDLDSLCAQLYHCETQLNKAEQRLQIIFDITPFGLVLIDQNHRIVNINEYAAAQFGLCKEHLKNRAIHCLIDDMDKVHSLLKWLGTESFQSFDLIAAATKEKLSINKMRVGFNEVLLAIYPQHEKPDSSASPSTPDDWP